MALAGSGFPVAIWCGDDFGGGAALMADKTQTDAAGMLRRMPQLVDHFRRRAREDAGMSNAEDWEEAADAIELLYVRLGRLTAAVKQDALTRQAQVSDDAVVERDVARAIMDPGTVIGLREPGEGLFNWQARAAMAVLRKAALSATNSEAVSELTRPIIGIENRTALEAFDIMADRIRAKLGSRAP